jgi:hypothetical protein
MLIAARAGRALHKRLGGRSTGSEGHIVPAVLGLLALLLGFTFSLAVDRFETRRILVLQEANAIGTSYLRAQALAEPHRSRMSKILLTYTEVRIALSKAPTDKFQKLLATNDRLLTDLWAATLAAHDSVTSAPLSVPLLTSVNEVIDLDASRKAARAVRVPGEVLNALAIYLIVAAGILGYSRRGTGAPVLDVTLFVLLTMSYMLILDIDRPALGRIVEGQGPMISLRNTLRQQPPGTFDRWREVNSAPGEHGP